MHRTWMTGMLIVIASSALTGCNQTLKEENALLTEENQNLRDQLSERNTALESVHGELRDRDMRLAEMRQQAGDQTTPSSGPFGDIEGVTGRYEPGLITASIESDVLFDSGKTTLKQRAKQSLDEVASVIISEYPGTTIRISGHTDTDPIRKSGFKTNYHLGFERAYVVREYLVSRGLPAKQIYVASYGPDRAMSSKEKSRRVEIAVVLNE